MSDVPAPELDADSDSAPVVSPAPVAMTKAATVEVTPVAASFSDYERECLIAIGTGARENNEPGHFKDGAGRDWAIMPDVVGSFSVILVKMTQGGTTKTVNLSTVIYSNDTLMKACISMAGM